MNKGSALGGRIMIKKRTVLALILALALVLAQAGGLAEASGG